MCFALVTVPFANYWEQSPHGKDDVESADQREMDDIPILSNLSSPSASTNALNSRSERVVSDDSGKEWIAHRRTSSKDTPDDSYTFVEMPECSSVSKVTRRSCLLEEILMGIVGAAEFEKSVTFNVKRFVV